MARRARKTSATSPSLSIPKGVREIQRLPGVLSPFLRRPDFASGFRRPVDLRRRSFSVVTSECPPRSELVCREHIHDRRQPERLTVGLSGSRSDERGRGFCRPICRWAGLGGMEEEEGGIVSAEALLRLPDAPHAETAPTNVPPRKLRQHGRTSEDWACSCSPARPFIGQIDGSFSPRSSSTDVYGGDSRRLSPAVDSAVQPRSPRTMKTRPWTRRTGGRAARRRWRQRGRRTRIRRNCPIAWPSAWPSLWRTVPNGRGPGLRLFAALSSHRLADCGCAAHIDGCVAQFLHVKNRDHRRRNRGSRIASARAAGSRPKPEQGLRGRGRHGRWHALVDPSGMSPHESTREARLARTEVAVEEDDVPV